MRWLHSLGSMMLVFVCVLSASGIPVVYAGEPHVVPNQTGAPVLAATQNGDGSWGVQIGNVGKAAVGQPKPVRLEIYPWGSRTPAVYEYGYSSTATVSGGFSGTRAATINGATFTVTDQWTLVGSVVTASRTLSITGDSSDGYVSALVLQTAQAAGPRGDVDYFVPGMIYGGTNGIEPQAIGGSNTYGAGYSGSVRIREDRIPGLLFGLRFNDNSSLALLNKQPQGDTIAADGDDDLGDDRIEDSRLRYGALGAEQPSNSVLRLGYWFPGTEGEVTYANNSSDGAQHTWRVRTHPVNPGATQAYTLQWRFGSGESRESFMKNTWRYAWSTLNPQVNKYTMTTVRQALTDHLANHVITDGGRSGIPNLWDPYTGNELLWFERRAYMGFIGRNLEDAEYLLREAQRRGGTDATRFRDLANKVIATQIAIDQSPPSGEGVKLNTGDTIFFPTDNVAYLRALTDGMDGLLRAYSFEKANGRTNAAWLNWVKDFGDWLLTQQSSDGSFPRAWNTGSTNRGTVAQASKNSSYLPIPFLLQLTQITGNTAYKNAAISAGNAAWTTYTNNNRVFIGGTPDHPNVMDHEAASLAMEAYLALYEATNTTSWLDRAKVAGDAVETWLYIWNVPMPVDELDSDLQWPRAASTVGMELITTGQSFTGDYSANDALGFAKLYKYTNDTHYRDVARITLHNSKNPLALPGRLHRMIAPGWQQEFWSFSVPRGYGETWLWSAWTPAAHLHGMVLMEAWDLTIYNQIANY